MKQDSDELIDKVHHMLTTHRGFDYRQNCYWFSLTEGINKKLRAKVGARLRAARSHVSFHPPRCVRRPQGAWDRHDHVRQRDAPGAGVALLGHPAVLPHRRRGFRRDRGGNHVGHGDEGKGRAKLPAVGQAPACVRLPWPPPGAHGRPGAVCAFAGTGHAGVVPRC